MDTASGDGETPPTPDESLQFIEEQRAATIRAVEPDLLLYYGPWGVAWLVGFGLFFLSYGLHDEPYVEMPAGLPLVVLYVLMAAAIAATVYASARAARGVKGPTTTQAAMYGWAWPFGFAGVIALAVRFGEGLPGPERGLLWSGLSLGVVGLLYVAGGAMWRDRPMYGLGVAFIVVNVIGVVLGPGWHAMIFALCGVAMLVTGAVVRVRK